MQTIDYQEDALQRMTGGTGPRVPSVCGDTLIRFAPRNFFAGSGISAGGICGRPSVRVPGHCGGGNPFPAAEVLP